MNKGVRKKLIFFVVALLIVASCVFVHPAQAQEQQQYYLQSISSNNKFVGARMFGNYFANDSLLNVEGIYSTMGISVVVEIYSSPALEINSKLNFSEQTETVTKLKEIFAQADKIATTIDNLTNPMYNGQNQLPTSDVYKYNNATFGQVVEISYHTHKMLQLAQQCYLQTDGLFNPCAYRLVDLWGFSSRVFTYGLTSGVYSQPYDRQFVDGGGYALPSQEYIQAFCNQDFVSFDPTSVALTEQDGKYYVTKNVAPAVVEENGQLQEYQQWLDLGGVAKGYVADLIAQLLEENGLARYYVSIGESSVRMGEDLEEDGHLIVQQDAFNPSYSAVGYTFADVGLACSGKYLRNYKVDGVLYNHIINPKTGAPSNAMAEGVLVAIEDGGYSATVTDCYATALSNMDEQQLVQFINNNPSLTISALCKNQKGQQTIVSTTEKSTIYTKNTTFNNYAWALEKNGDEFYLNNNAVAPSAKNNGPTIAIIVGSAVVACAVVIVFVYFVKSKKGNGSNAVLQAKKQKPFVSGDVGLYMILAIVVVILLVAVTPQKTAVKQVEVYDMQTDQLIFTYDISKDKIYVHQQNGWTILTDRQQNTLTVTFSKKLDGQMHFNILQIDISNNSVVQMADSLCGRHQECVKTFEPITRAGGTIVCSPNNLKVVTN